jgi:hypothetical protein
MYQLHILKNGAPHTTVRRFFESVEDALIYTITADLGGRGISYEVTPV